MTKKKEDNKPQEVKTEITLADFTLFFELENILACARERLFQQVAESMKKWDKELTVPEFSRYCLYPLPKHFVPKLAAAYGLTSEQTGKWAAELEAARVAYLTSPGLKVHAGMKALIEAALAKGLPVCALSALTPTQTQNLLAHSGLGSAGVEMFCSDEVDANFPRADTWMKMARELNKTSRRCVVFAGSSRACKAALSSGMRSVAVPDAYTSFQDYSGSEMILEGEKGWKSEDILKFLYPVGR
ncbi:MAG: HAD family hydrolase [Kiritimatiellae bacterium]|nr:HAD family hydrolase [Kiritimatiellia bacterium]